MVFPTDGTENQPVELSEKYAKAKEGVATVSHLTLSPSDELSFLMMGGGLVELPTLTDTSL